MATPAKRTLRVVVPALGAVAALALTACSGGGSGSSTAGGFEGVELTVWNNIDFDPYQTLQKEYFEECADELGITVDVQTITGEYTSRLLQASSSKSLPDISLLSTDTQVSLLAEQGVLGDLDALGVSTDGIAENVADLGRFDGTLYALPTQVENYVLFYDTAAFAAAGIDAPPTTFDELVADAAAIAATGEYGIALPGVSGDGSTAAYFLPFLLSAGGDPADPTSDGAVAAVELYQQLVAEGGLSKEFVNWGWDVTDQWLGQKAAIQVSGPWNLVDTSIPFEYGTAPIPTLTADEESKVGLLGYGYGVSAAADTAHQQAAAALIECRASEENQLDTAVQGGYIPALTSAQEAFVAEVPAAASFVDAVPNGYNAAELGTEWNSLQQVYIDAIQDAAVNGTSAADALEKAAQAQ
ncbi:MAG: extracellular solute-binding protein [Microbacterium sp.]|uniref:sugar ABC transporter substrate-binding protein n=1 Tax=Microbacterium sp. TaxID=51671 RepID=UPI00260DB5B7|nr:extracellular solute-binding protein [Microbacterium sp.]MCX6503286.1 extracellular solute-binding protein [Microbacterium sp.]